MIVRQRNNHLFSDVEESYKFPGVNSYIFCGIHFPIFDECITLSFKLLVNFNSTVLLTMLSV